METRRYPIGIQSFEQVREGKYVYVDKTELVYQLTHSYQNVFLSRPRRFGKTLLVSTLEAYFQGRKELFEGLRMAELETEWKAYPVLRFDMSGATVGTVEELKNYLGMLLGFCEEIYGKGEGEIDLNQRLVGLIRRAKAKTGMPVVVLVDEYDKPLLDVINDEEKMEAARLVMRNFYSPLKMCNGDLRFLFLTGITKFSQLSIFSELNNLSNISLLPSYSAICGITEEEMIRELDGGIEELAKELEVSKDECIDRLKKQYDGYHFSRQSPDIYNPFSLIQALATKEISAYWFASATPTFLLHQLKRFNVDPQHIGNRHVWASAFDAPTQDMKSATPLLYQSGYLTIKDYDKATEEYTLDIPNKEVRQGLMDSMLPYVLPYEDVIPAQQLVANMYRAFRVDDINTVLEHLKTFLGTVPYTDNTAKDYEGHYQTVLYVIFSLLCRYVQVEVRTPRGRVDVVLESPQKIYLIELKLNGSAEQAVEQIDLKNYPERFALTGKPTVRVGVNFSRETRNVTDWKVE